MDDIQIFDNEVMIMPDFPSLTYIGDDLEIEGNDYISEINFPALLYVDDNVEILSNFNLTKVLFPSLLYVEDDFELQFGANYSEINLESLIFVGDNLEFEDLSTDDPANMIMKFDSLLLSGDILMYNVAAEEFNFPELLFVEDNLKFYDNEYAAVLSLPKLQAVEEDVNFASDDPYRDIYNATVGMPLMLSVEFPALEYIGDDFWVAEDQFPALVNFSFPQLERIDGDRGHFNFSLSPDLEGFDFPKFKGFRNLTEANFDGTFELLLNFNSGSSVATDDNLWPVITCKGGSFYDDEDYDFQSVALDVEERILNATQCEDKFDDHFDVNYLLPFLENAELPARVLEMMLDVFS